YRRLFGFFPDNPEYGLALGEAWIRAGQPAQARDVLAQLRRLPAPVAGDPRLEQLAGDIADAQGNYIRLRDATSAAAAAATRRGGSLLEAESLSTRAWAHVFLGNPKQGLADVTRAREIYAALGQQPGLADAMTAMGSIVSMQGHHRQSTELERQAAEIQR